MSTPRNLNRKSAIGLASSPRDIMWGSKHAGLLKLLNAVSAIYCCLKKDLMVSFRVLYFGQSKDFTQISQERLNVEGTETTLKFALDAVKQTHPRITEFLDKCAFSVGLEYADMDTKICEDAEVGVIPPVSAG